jgi:hypothetical protein
MNTEQLKKIIVTQREDMEDLFKNERIIERDIDIEGVKRFISHPNKK